MMFVPFLYRADAAVWVESTNTFENVRRLFIAKDKHNAMAKFRKYCTDNHLVAFQGHVGGVFV